MRNIKPIGNLVVLFPVKQPKTSDGGIHLIEQSNPQNQLWTVFHVGSGHLNKKGVRIPIELKPGDKVITRPLRENISAFPDGVEIVDYSVILAKIEQ